MQNRPRQSVAAAGLGAPWMTISIDVYAPDLSHACALQYPARRGSHDHLIQRDGSSTARLKFGAQTRDLNGPSTARRDPPPLRLGAALLCITSRLKLAAT